MIEAGPEPSTQRAAVVGAGGEGDNLETATVMAFDKLGELGAHGMFAEVRRDIAQPDAVMAPAFALPKRRHGRVAFRHDIARRLKLQHFVAVERE